MAKSNLDENYTVLYIFKVQQIKHRQQFNIFLARAGTKMLIRIHQNNAISMKKIIIFLRLLPDTVGRGVHRLSLCPLTSLCQPSLLDPLHESPPQNSTRSTPLLMTEVNSNALSTYS